ncbi:MAG: ROK family protein [Prevotellaceae bacterium]|jgi:predicted NBD/HSP70 family sugar kinase/mannose-6-phosphate isomerase class I|nr:ROK family protein [Prevotellaceae bacterium]
MNDRYYIGADIGGTHISCAPVNIATKEIPEGKIYRRKVDSKASCSTIIEAWKALINEVISLVGKVEGIGLAVPGPFDEEGGISQIIGVHKFDSLFGLNVREAIRPVFRGKAKPVMFVNDAAGFALGEYYAGAAQGSKRTLAITLGTGFGSAFLLNGTPQREAKNGVPPKGYLYNLPFGESIADDYFSTRWFANEWKKKTGENIKEVKEIALFAENRDVRAIAIFDEFADNLISFLSTHTEHFAPDTLVVGGNIAKAHKLFIHKIKETFGKKGIAVKVCELWDNASIIGAAMSLGQIPANDKRCRKTEQFLAPVKAEKTCQGIYDIYPAFPLEQGKIACGIEAIATKMSIHNTIIIDGYVGVYWDKLAEELSAALVAKGKTVRWFQIDAAMKPAEQIEEMLKPYLGGDDPVFGKITDKKLSDWFDPDKLQRIQVDSEVDINIIAGCGAALAGWNGELIYVDLPKNELQFRARAGAANNLGARERKNNQQTYKRFYFVDWCVLNKHKSEILPEIKLIIDGQRPDNYLCMSGDELRAGLETMSRNFFRVRPWFEPGPWGGNWMKTKIEGLNKEVINLAWSFELMTLENGLMFESEGYRMEVSFDFLMYAQYRKVLGDCADRFKYDFPIRFDFLDTFDGGNLSVQCHPRPEYIQQEFGMPFTQDESYYILDCQNTSTVYLGFQENINPEKFYQALSECERKGKDPNIESFVQKHKAKKHDLFLIPNGTIHASGKDNLVLEISSAPYIFTFKMYDWLRLDLDGRPRPISIEHAMKNLYFDRRGETAKNELICKPYIINQSPDCVLEHLPTHPAQFYDVHRYTFDKEITVETSGKCHVWMLVEGSSIMLETAEGMKQRFNYAETFVIPAAAERYTIKNESPKPAIMVKAFVKSI